MSFYNTKIKTKEIKTASGVIKVKSKFKEVAKCPKCKAGLSESEGLNNYCLSGKHKVFE